jgi:hypothetical protein
MAHPPSRFVYLDFELDSFAVETQPLLNRY